MALTQSNAELERFNYITAHDLKEPARNLVSYSSLLDRKCLDGDIEAIRDYSQLISKNALSLYNLIDDILTFSDVRNKENLKFKNVNLDRIISDIEEMLSETIRERNVNLSIFNLPSVKGEYSMILILFKNLIENAIKYNNDKEVVIEIGQTQAEEGVRIYVKDNGIGIDPQFQNKIFEMFGRLHPKSEFDGSGLGLSLCQKIADLHGFELSVESDGATGSTFYIDIQST